MPKERPGLRRQLEQGGLTERSVPETPTSKRQRLDAHSPNEKGTSNLQSGSGGYARGQVSLRTKLGAAAAHAANRVNEAAGMNVLSASAVLGQFLRDNDDALAEMLERSLGQS